MKYCCSHHFDGKRHHLCWRRWGHKRKHRCGIANCKFEWANRKKVKS